jgi:hypothetical protein
MRNTILILTAIASIFTFLTSFDYEEKGIVNDKLDVETISISIDYSNELKSENASYYDDYMNELKTTGPKEGAELTNSAEPNVAADVVVNNIAFEKTYTNKPSKIEEEIQKEKEEVKESIESVGEVDHRVFGRLLQKHVDVKGNVNYKAFKNDEAELDAYLEQLKANPVKSSMSKNVRLSYWINAYNAFTIKLILENYPVKSIKDIASGKPWDKVFIKLGNTSYSLNMIENEVIRKRFTEPRIHFAVNCAAASCPPLLNEAFYPSTITEQLGKQTKSFLNDSYYNTITKNKLEVSKIFDWYGVDFKDVKSYINSKVDIDVSGLTLTFKEYDWALNEQ